MRRRNKRKEQNQVADWAEAIKKHTQSKKGALYNRRLFYILNGCFFS
jgi:hypothetical protein